MKIGIIGSGVVGKALAAGFSKYRYEVMAGSREPGKLVEWKTEISGNLKIGTFGETAVFGEIIVLATTRNGSGKRSQTCGHPQSN